MKRALNVTALLAMGFLMATPPATAQLAGTGAKPCVTTSTSTSGGQVTVGVLGADDVDSSKFREYRDVPEGFYVPCFNLFSTSSKVDFNLFGYNVRQTDQRYNGWFNTSAFDLSFDYNQTPHNMGNDAHTIMAELSEGVWGMSDTLQQSLGTTVNATPTAGRTVTFYDTLLGPTFASAGSVDVSSTRKRGTATLDLGKKLPFDLTFTYMRELKSGYRGEEGGGVYSAVNSVVEMPGPLNETTQDFGVQAAWNFAKGNIHGRFSRNLYDNDAETLTVDNPFQWYDQPYVTTPAPAVGGGMTARWINAPDNEASTGNLGFLLKLGRQTRIGGDLTLGRWTQNAPFHPYTINTAILTPAGVNASSLSALQQPSFDGKIDTTTINLTFSSRPVENLAIRAQFRSYDLTNKTDRFVITGDVAASPDRSWSVVTPSAADPYGHATANVYDNKTTRFTASASYDIGALTLEGQVRFANLERTSREATKGDDNGFALTAVYRAKDWLDLRATYDQAKRTAEGETLYGFQSDEAERETKRTGIQVDVTPVSDLTLSLAYFRRDVEYPNRPDRIAVTVRRADARRAADTRHAQRPARGEVRLVHRGGRVLPERAGRARCLLHLREGRHHEPVVHDHRRQPEQHAQLRGHRQDRHVRPRRDLPAQAGRVEALGERHAPEGGRPDGHHGPGVGLVLHARPHDARSRGNGRGPGHRRLGRHHADDVRGAARLRRGQGLDAVGRLRVREVRVQGRVHGRRPAHAAVRPALPEVE